MIVSGCTFTARGTVTGTADDASLVHEFFVTVAVMLYVSGARVNVTLQPSVNETLLPLLPRAV